MFIVKNINSTLIKSFASALLLIIGAKVIIPFYPVNLTLQTMMVGVSVIALGNRASLMGMGLYILAGAAGLPVFTAGAGLAYMLGASGGFITGLALSNYIQTLNFSNTITKYVLGTAVVYLLGGLWLHQLGFDAMQITLSYMPAELTKLFAFAGLTNFIKKN